MTFCDVISGADSNGAVAESGLGLGVTTAPRAGFKQPGTAVGLIPSQPPERNTTYSFSHNPPPHTITHPYSYQDLSQHLAGKIYFYLISFYLS